MKKPDPWEVPMSRAYKLLFNAITDATGKLERRNLMGALALLKQAQLDAEEILIGTEPIPFPVPELSERS